MSKLERQREALEKQRRQYADKWSMDSKRYRDNADYSWMESHIKGYKTVVEIGTGDGSSTLTLLEREHIVIGIDENVECLKMAAAKIKAAGFPVELLQRERIRAGKEGGYQLEYKPLRGEVPAAGALLIEGDILNDTNLLEWLIIKCPFDAVVCWLIGSHGARALNEAIKARTPGNYRFSVQNRMYEVADQILRENGVLHIVDRIGESGSKDQKEILLDSHRDQASVTSLDVSIIELREQPHFQLGKESMELGRSQGTITYEDSTEIVLASVLSVKPTANDSVDGEG